MVDLVPIDHDPWNDEPAPTPVGYPVTPDVAEANALGPRLEPVDNDPFAGAK